MNNKIASIQTLLSSNDLLKVKKAIVSLINNKDLSEGIPVGYLLCFYYLLSEIPNYQNYKNLRAFIENHEASNCFKISPYKPSSQLEQKILICSFTLGESKHFKDVYSLEVEYD